CRASVSPSPAVPPFRCCPCTRAGRFTGACATTCGGGRSRTPCEYWRYCAIDGFLCGCCGGSANSCPPGTEAAPVTWIGTCRNPVDGKDYVISYNDCCGKSTCNRCMCNRNEGDRPVYMPAKSNDINWCHGTSNNVYHCSTGVVLGLAVDS
ncbi:MAG: methylamine dehydrogenase (amicyanin) light chain, partial [Gammaproteobacteria bacterium]|nr:methylamine dehydrogenase (amicyanin) light chain [Gammaproteobacteria bacterium]